MKDSLKLKARDHWIDRINEQFKGRIVRRDQVYISTLNERPRLESDHREVLRDGKRGKERFDKNEISKVQIIELFQGEESLGVTIGCREITAIPLQSGESSSYRVAEKLFFKEMDAKDYERALKELEDLREVFRREAMKRAELAMQANRLAESLGLEDRVAPPTRSGDQLYDFSASVSKFPFQSGLVLVPMEPVNLYIERK